MLENDYFLTAFTQTMVIEGEKQLTKIARDPGGMTYSGISRVYWPHWEGWKVIDAWLSKRAAPIPDALDGMVSDFYRVNFWGRIQGDALATLSPKLAYEVFDTAVNLDVTPAVRFLQKGYNVARGEAFQDLLVDGKLGPKTIGAIGIYLSSLPGGKDLNEEILLNCMNGEQYIYYRANPRRKYFRGWFRRV